MGLKDVFQLGLLLADEVINLYLADFISMLETARAQG